MKILGVVGICIVIMFVYLGSMSIFSKKSESIRESVAGTVVFWDHDDNDAPSVYTINLSGGDRRLIHRGGFHPVWSEDGNKIYFMQSGDFEARQVLMNSDGTTIVEASDGPSSVESMTSHADDLYVEHGSLYHRLDEAHSNLLYEYKPLLGYDNKLNIGVTGARWSPDKEYVIFSVSSLGKGSRIYIADLQGNSFELTKGFDPDWRKP